MMMIRHNMMISHITMMCMYEMPCCIIDKEFSDTQPLNDVINDECIKTYACMLHRVTCEGCVGLYHMNDLR